MGNKKDFSGAFENARKAVNATKKQETASPEEKAYREANGITQGRKGCKMQRINMGFTTDNYKFIKILSRATGRTMTVFVNNIIEQYRREHPEQLELALDFLEEIGGDLDDFDEE